MAEIVRTYYSSGELIYVVLSTTINDIDIEEINIFTEEEWNKLNIMNKVFRKHQINLEDMSDDSYSRYFDKTNPQYEENKKFEKYVYFMDRELTKQFNVKFRDLAINYDYVDNNYDNIFVTNTLRKNILRNWFVDNYKTINEYYNYVNNK
jgi:hypothetical protein